MYEYIQTKTFDVCTRRMGYALRMVQDGGVVQERALVDNDAEKTRRTINRNNNFLENQHKHKVYGKKDYRYDPHPKL